MAQRTGISSLNSLAKQMCRAVTIFTPIIRRVYPENEAILAALDAANAACALLEQETASLIVYGD